MIYGNPRRRAVFYGPERPTYGPARFEHQPPKVRRRGRKGLALKSRRMRLRTKASWAWHRGDLDEAKSLRRKSGGRKRRGSSSSRSSRSSKRRRGARYTLSRKGWRATSKGRRSSRGSNRRSGRSMSRRSSGSMRRGSGRSGRPMSMAGVHSFLRSHRGTKAWICVGPKRTGCGGGKKGGRGSRVLGFLR